MLKCSSELVAIYLLVYPNLCAAQVSKHSSAGVFRWWKIYNALSMGARHCPNCLFKFKLTVLNMFARRLCSSQVCEFRDFSFGHHLCREQWFVPVMKVSWSVHLVPFKTHILFAQVNSPTEISLCKAHMKKAKRHWKCEKHKIFLVFF